MSEPPPEGRARRPLRGDSLLLLATLFAMIAIVIALLFSNQISALTTRLYPSPTATTSSALPEFHATETAQARQLIQPYTPAGIGPCDTADPPYSPENNSYWQWTQPGPFTCDVGFVTEITGEGYITFYGFPNGLPRNFETSFTVTFHASASTAAPLCLTYGMNGATRSLMFCDDGTWNSTSFYSPSGAVAKAASYLIVMDAHEGLATFSVNGLELVLSVYDPSLTDISFYSRAVPPGARIDISRFSLTPSR